MDQNVWGQRPGPGTGDRDRDQGPGPFFLITLPFRGLSWALPFSCSGKNVEQRVPALVTGAGLVTGKILNSGCQYQRVGDQGPGPGPGTRDQGPGTGTRDQGPGTRDRDQGPGPGTSDQGPGTRQNQASHPSNDDRFPKTFPSEGPKVRCLSAKSRLPELFVTRRRFNYFHLLSRGSGVKSPVRNLPNTRRWSG